MDLPVSCPSLARRAFPYPVDGLVFDMDGILLDTEPLYRAAFTEAAAALGFAVGEDFYSSLLGLSTRERGALVQAHFGGDFPLEPFLAHYYERKRAAVRRGIPLKRGATELLHCLRERALPLALATSATENTTYANLRRCGLLELFDAVVTRDDVEHGKPHPEPFLKAARKLGVPPARCLGVEDSHHGIEALHGAGMMAVMVPDLLLPTEAIRRKCVTIAESLHELRELLLRP